MSKDQMIKTQQLLDLKHHITTGKPLNGTHMGLILGLVDEELGEAAEKTTSAAETRKLRDFFIRKPT